MVALKTGELTLRNILVPIDSSPDATAAVEFARRAADILVEDNVDITLLHVGDGWPPIVKPADGQGWTFHIVQRRGENASEEILSSAQALSSDLIVMATAGHDGVMDALRGSTTEHVVRQARCPVLAVPAK